MHSAFPALMLQQYPLPSNKYLHTKMNETFVFFQRSTFASVEAGAGPGRCLACGGARGCTSLHPSLTETSPSAPGPRSSCGQPPPSKDSRRPGLLCKLSHAREPRTPPDRKHPECGHPGGWPVSVLTSLLQRHRQPQKRHCSRREAKRRWCPWTLVPPRRPAPRSRPPGQRGLRAGKE